MDSEENMLSVCTQCNPSNAGSFPPLPFILLDSLSHTAFCFLFYLSAAAYIMVSPGLPEEPGVMLLFHK